MYPILDVEPFAALSTEQMGSKSKFWIEHPDLGLSLFRISRPGTGEHWAEKIARELCRALRIHCADYEIAILGGQLGTLSPDFRPKGFVLVHGNEILGQRDPSYQIRVKHYRTSQHTLGAVVKQLAEIQRPWGVPPEPPGLCESLDWFVGYLLLDALIGNTDRHDQNWGGLRSLRWPPPLALAPSYDHASSLGSHLLDEDRLKRLNTRDRGFSPEAYADRCRSAFFDTTEDRKPMGTTQAFRQAVQLRPAVAEHWLRNLNDLSMARIDWILEQVPPSIFSSPSRDFARAILHHNRKVLLS